MDGRSTPRLRRSLLITPGDRPERMAKAAQLDADGLVLDLEDGVGPEQKAAARVAVTEALASLDFGGRERIVRVNAVDSDEHGKDLEALDVSRIDAIFLPKVESGRQVEALGFWLDEQGTRRPGGKPVEIIATIETPRGLMKALEIAEASARTTALFFGSGDYTAATGSAVTERSLATPRALIVAAAAAVGIEAIDAAYFTAVKDVEATRTDAFIARELGFAGKLVFHPSQIAVANEVFTPSAEEIARARRILDAWGEAQRAGRGTAYNNGEFIAVDIAIMAERVLAKAQQAGATRKK
ncbi:MAG: CoA ester lyase [Hyphomicrobiaceae bacterium]